MKVSEIKQLIESIVTDEVRKTIMEEAEGNKEVYHIKCEGIPLGTYNSQEEAENDMDKFKEMHPGKELIIEKGVYESHHDMLDKLDEMNDQLEETDNMENTEMQPEEGNAFGGALAAAKLKGDKEFKVGDKEYDVKEEEDCEECGGSYMEEEEEGGDDFEEMLRGRRRKHSYVDNGEETPDEMGEEKKCCEKCGKEMCECGGGGMYESKKKTLRLSETELTKMIAKMVSESIPGLDAAKKSHTESGKENKANIASVEKKIADFNNVEGNDNPKFPNAIGKGEKVARKNTSKEEETIEDNRGRNPLDLTYDIEPSDQFKDRLKKSIEGHSTMGNAPTTEKPSIKPSNGADKGEESKDKDGNVIATPETGKKFEKESKRRIDIKKDEPVYNKEAVPVKSKSKSINEEVEKMKKMFNYNKKTQ